MSSILPQYTKSLFRDEVTSEDDRLLGQPTETDDVRATYPPAEGGASSSTAGPETVRTFALPSHLANYELDGQFTLWKRKTAICGREQTRQDTIESLVSAFPMLYRRDARTIRFQVACPPPSGSTEARWSEVTEAIWHDVMCTGKPDNIRLCLDLTPREHFRQWFNCIAMFGSPVWLIAFGFLVAYIHDLLFSGPDTPVAGPSA